MPKQQRISADKLIHQQEINESERDPICAAIAKHVLDVLPVDRPALVVLSGSVAAGKSTFAERLVRQLALNDSHARKIVCLSTDHFLKCNADLQAEGRMDRKGFPESYDQQAIQNLAQAFRAGERLERPIYDHAAYDILPGQSQTVPQADILLLEGVAALQFQDQLKPDYALYLDANEADLFHWYHQRLISLIEAAKDQPDQFFYTKRDLTAGQILDLAKYHWQLTNLPNLKDYIGPSARWADLIIHKASDHHIESVTLHSP